MTLKGTYKLIYTIDKKQEELTVIVELKQYDGLIKSMQNVYYGVALVNGVLFEEVDLSHCVNGKYASQSIGTELRNKLMKKCREDKKLFRVIKEEIK